MAVRDKKAKDKDGGSKFLADHKIAKKEFGKKMEGESLVNDNSTSWSNRQLDWYNSERRLIFAVDPQSKTYVDLINS